jgi:hypothetical protein
VDKLDLFSESIPLSSREALQACVAELARQRARFPSKAMTAHGDLNSGNVLFEAGAAASYPVFIDFASVQRSNDNVNYPLGAHFPFWDYAKLERDLKTRLFLKEAVAENLSEDEILSTIREVDAGTEPAVANTRKSPNKLFLAISSLRAAVREQHAPTLYLACYRLAVAYATLSVLYRSQPDDDLDLGLQRRVAVESACALLQACLGRDLGGRAQFEEEYQQTSLRVAAAGQPKDAKLAAHQDERSELLMLRLHDFGSTCVVGKAKGERPHLWVPGHAMDMQWGASSEDERLAWLYVVDTCFCEASS